MTTVKIPMASPNPLKRPFDHTQVPLGGGGPQEDTQRSEQQSEQAEASRSTDQPHPQLLEQVQVTEANGFGNHLPLAVCTGPAFEDPNIPAASSTSSAKPTSKRQKLAQAEQETKRKEKEAKDRQRAEEKAKKDGEKEEKRKVREAQIKAKEEEKVLREKVREAQLKAKEDEKRKKEGEKNKKEKAQLRLNSFFVQSSSTGSTRLNGQSPKSSPQSSVISINDGVNPHRRSASPKTPKTQSSEYERHFPHFYVHLHTTLAPETRFSRDEDGLKYARIKIDEQIQASEDSKRLPISAFNPSELLHVPPHKQSSRSRQRNTVKDLIARIHGTSQNPIDLTDSSSKAVDKPTALLAAIPVKYLRFAEDVRPPYIGTYTKVSDPRACSKLRRNPFTRSLPMNYDYDSEAEWEEPGEGEDLDSEGEEDAGEDDEEDEMEGFLDDEEGADAKRRLVASDLETLSIGICWEDMQNAHCSIEEDQGLDLQSFRLEMISETFQLPIHPYSTAYWQPRPLEIPQAQCSIPSAMDPPRIPLSNISSSNNFKTTPSTSEALKVPLAGTEISIPAKPLRAPKRLIAMDTLEAFKFAVAGSDLTKTGLVEILKKQFPKEPKDAIKETLGLIAERVGPREAEKKWIIKAEYSTACS